MGFYKVAFIYSDSELENRLGRLGKTLVEKDMVAAQNLAADYFNERYQAWNDEYDRNGQGMEYYDFIRAKQEEIIAATKGFNKFMTITVKVGPECELVGQVKPIIALMFGEPKLVHLTVRIGLKEVP